MTHQNNNHFFKVSLTGTIVAWSASVANTIPQFQRKCLEGGGTSDFEFTMSLCMAVAL